MALNLEELTETDCGTNLSILVKALKLKKIIKSTRDAIGKIQETFLSIQWGIIPKELLASMTAAAIQIAGDLSNSLLGNLSAAIQISLAAILAPLLKLILAFPQSLMSLIRIPQDSAIAAVNAERKYLSRAKHNLYIISRIIYKWTGAGSRHDYSKQMEKVVKLIGESRKFLDPVISKLTIQDKDETSSAYFDVNNFNKSLNRLRLAIDTIDVGSDSIIVENINKARGDRTEEIYQESSKKIRAQKKQALNNLADEYQVKAQQGSSGKTEVVGKTPLEKAVNSARTDVVAAWYRESKTVINELYKAKFAAARASAEAQAAIDPKVYAAAGAGVSDEFRADLDLALQNAGDYARNIRSAYIYNKNSQACTVSVYNYKTLISKMVGYLIDLIRKAGNGSAKAPAALIAKADEKMEIVELMFQETLDSKDGDGRFSMLKELAAGQQLLRFAKALMVTGSGDEIIRVINADDELLTADKRLNTLLEKIKEIPDWEGKKNIWGTKMELIQIGNPYAVVIPKALLLTTALPPTLFLGTSKKIRKKMREYTNITNGLIQHNRTVKEALESYLVPKHPVVESLEKALRIAGLLNIFAVGFSLKSVISQMVDVAKDLSALRDCRDANNGKFDGETIAAADMTNYEYETKGAVEDVQITNPNAITYKISKKITFEAERDDVNSRILEESNGNMGDDPFQNPPPEVIT